MGCAQSRGKLCGPRLFHLLFPNLCFKKKKKKKVRLYIFNNIRFIQYTYFYTHIMYKSDAKDTTRCQLLNIIE